MYLEQLKTSLLATVVLSALTGLAYPLAITGISQALFPKQANGDLTLVGRSFDDPKYFWGRLSATSPAPYNAAASSGSNLGPLNPALLKAVQDRIDALRKVDPQNAALVPVDLVTSSGSGLDPHITPAAARYQLKRVARVRGLPEATVESLVDKSTQGRLLGFIGEPRVNVSTLNAALDEVSGGPKT